MNLINKTTSAERLELQNNTYDLTEKLDRAAHLLYRIYYDYFSYTDTKIEEQDLEYIGIVVYTAYDMISDFLLEYALTVGAFRNDSVQRFLEIMKQVMTAKKCEDLGDEVRKMMKGDKAICDVILSRFKSIMKLPDEQAIPAFNELLKSSGK